MPGTEETKQPDLSKLIEKIGRRDRGALIALYEATGSRLYGTILQNLQEGPQAEEALIETYTDVWRESSFYDVGSADPREWLSALARTRALGYADRPGVREPVEEVAPPAFLRDLISVRVEHEAELLAEPMRSKASPSEKETTREPILTAGRQEKTWGGARLAWSLAVLLGLIAAFFFFSSQQARKEASRQSARAEEAGRETSELRGAIASERKKATALEQDQDMLSDPGTRLIFLSGAQSTDSSAALFWNPDRKRLIGTLHLPPAPEGKTYQLWFVTRDGKSPVGLLETDEEGCGLQTLDVRIDPSLVTAAGITLEPAGGSPQPTTRFYVLGRLGS